MKDLSDIFSHFLGLDDPEELEECVDPEVVERLARKYGIAGCKGGDVIGFELNVKVRGNGRMINAL